MTEDLIQSLQDALNDRIREAAEHRASFDLRWKADMRAIKRWQAAHSDRPNVELTWPDHADMVVWLLGEVERLKDAVSRALVETGDDPEPWGWTSPEIANAIIILKVARDS